MDLQFSPRAFSNSFRFSVLCGLFILGLLCVQSAGTSRGSSCDLSRQFPCRTHPHKCIDISQVRDGRSDCPDGSDEECPEGMHRCVCGLPRCIERNKVGDGIKHCQDGSDEGEDGSNYLCPESSSEENPFAVEMKKRRRRLAGYRNDPVVYPTGLISTFVGTEVNGDQTTLHTTHRYRTYVDGSYTELLESTSVVVPTPTLDAAATGMEATANIHRFGSLNSGKVYLTAVNEPISAISSGPEGPIKITGTFLPPDGQVTTKQFALDIEAQTIGSLYPDKSGSSIITVTGTKGTFIQPDSTTDRVFPVYTGSYISGNENPTTYKFFFGNHPLTSDVQVIVPTTTAKVGDFTENYEAEESEIQASLSKNDNSIANLLLDSSVEEIPEPYYRSLNKSILYHETIPTVIPENNPIAITRFVQPTAYPETDEPVLAVAGRNTIGVVGNIRNPSQISTLRGHHSHYRQGRMQNPPPSGRRIGQYGPSIITDQYVFPGHRIESSPADDKDFHDFQNAYYNINDAKLQEQLRKIVRPTSSRIKDSRLTRTVGIYGPIYELDDVKTTGSNAKSAEMEDSFSSLDDSFDETGDTDFTTTLYGFAEFSTKISGTQYIFLPASTRARTFTPRVTRTSFTNGIPQITRSQSASNNIGSTTEPFFRKPLFGTETREFVSQNSMFTSTIKDSVEIQKTMSTSTVTPQQFSDSRPRGRNVENSVTSSVIAEILPFNLATIYEKETMSSRHPENRNLFLNFKPVRHHEYSTASLSELDVSEIVDDKEMIKDMIEPNYPTGLVSSITGTEVAEGTTTHWTTLIFGTYIDNTYAHVIESTSSIFFTVSNTLSPEESLSMSDVKHEDNNMSSNDFEHGDFSSSIELFSSLTDLTSSMTATTNNIGDMVSSTPTLEILTSGFILPRNGRNRDLDRTSIILSKLSEDLMPTKTSAALEKSDIEMDISDDETETSMNENESSDNLVHIITDSFILPGGVAVSSSINKDAEVKDVSSMNSETSSTFLNDLDRLINGLPSPDKTENENVNTRSDSSEKSETETYENRNSIIKESETSKLVFITGGFILPSSSGLISTPVKSLESISSEFQTDVIPNSIITGGFILPSMKALENEESVITPSVTSTSIITDGFILPSQPLTKENSDSIAATKSSLSILTDGFILPGLNNGNGKPESATSSVNALPSSALLIAEPTLVDDINDIEGRSAGTDERVIVFDSSSSIPSDTTNLPTSGDKIFEEKYSTNSDDITLRMGKALYSVEENVEKPKADEILPSISFPITYFTTSTYFTTYLVDGSSIVSSRKETVSHVYTDSEHLKLAKINPTETIILPDSVKPTKTKSPEDFTTYTYFTTFYKDGSKVVTSRVETETSNLEETPTPVIESKPTFSILTYPTTYYTTLTYFTTLLRGSSSEVISSETVVSNVVTPTFGSSENSQFSSKIISSSKAQSKPTTYFTTYTYFTTFHKDGTTSVSTNYQTVSNIIYGKENILSTPVSSIYKTDDPGKIENYVPTTFYTTYTYYTTYLRSGTPIVSSREETVSNVGRAKATESEQFTSKSNGVNSSPKDTTYYTTYTYYTTLLKDGTTTVSTRKETVSNILGASVSTTPFIVRTQSPSTNIVTNAVTDSVFSSTPLLPTRSFETYFTTLTSYYTLFNGDVPSVNTVYSTLTDVVAMETPVQNKQLTSSQEVVKASPIVTTYYTTYTYFTSLLNSSTPVVESREVVASNIVTLTDLKSSSTQYVENHPVSISESIIPTSVTTKTLYTTYTFYKTHFFSIGTPSVTTRYETVTNFITETISRTQSHSQFEVPQISSSINVSPSIVRESYFETTSHPVLLKPTTVYSTFTFYSTIFSGDTSVVKSSTRVISSVIGHPEVTESKQKTLIAPSTAINTVYTTFTYYTTLFPNGVPEIQTRYETKSNMITLTIIPTLREKVSMTSDLDAAEGELHEKRVQPTPVITFYSTDLFVTTTSKPQDGSNFLTRQVTASASVQKDDSKGIVLEPSILKECCGEGAISYPYTFYTTYTYYTTRFHGDRPIINTRYETLTNVIKVPATAPLSSEITITSTLQSANDIRSTDLNDINVLFTTPSRFTTVSEPSIYTTNSYQYEPPNGVFYSIKSRKDDVTNTTINEDPDKNTLEGIESIESTTPLSENSTSTTEKEDFPTPYSFDFTHDSAETSPSPFMDEKSTTQENATFNTIDKNSKTTEDPLQLYTESNSTHSTEETTSESPTTQINLASTTVLEVENKTETTTEEITTTTEKITTTTEEISTTTAASTDVPVRSIFSRRRNRPQYKPRPSFRSSSTPTSTSTTPKSFNKATTTSKPAVNINRRNSTRPSFRRPSLAPRVNPLQRFRPRPTISSKEEESKRRKRSFFNVENNFEEMPKIRKILSTSDDSSEKVLKNNDLISEKRDTDSNIRDKENYPLGLLRSMEEKAINNGVTTVYATEIHGTFINGAYAQVVQSKVRSYSENSNEIAKTPIFSPSVSTPVLEKRSETETNKVGLVSSKVSTLIKDMKTTVFTTNVYGTYIGDVYAHLAQTTTNIISPTPTTQNIYPTGLISSSIRSEENYGTTTLWTTQIYGTFVNNYYAHIASTFSNVLAGQDQRTPSLVDGIYHQYAQATPDHRIPTPTARSMDGTKEYKTGLLSSIISEDEKDGTTTQYITNIYGTYIGQQYAKHAQTASKIILPTKSESSPTRSIGLLSTFVNSAINGNTATIYKTEIFGTYIGQLYAQLARTSTEYSYIHKTSSPITTSQVAQKTGLITSSVVRSEINEGTTTMHINEIYGTYIGNAYAHIAKSTSKVIKPTLAESKSSTPDNHQKIGLISSSVKTEVNDGTTTLHIAEVHGTYVGNYYAHVARRTSSVLPFAPISTSTTDLKPTSTTQLNSEGLISSEIRTEVNYGTTTLHTREIHGTYINGFYAHVARSSSNVITSTVSASNSNSGLVSAITNTEVNEGITTLHTTEIYGTSINGFYAHIARSTSNVINSTPTSKPVGIISTTTSTEINNGGTTLHRTSVIGLEIDGTYMQSIKVTSSIIPASSLFLESIIKSTISTEPKILHSSTAKDDLDTARVNELDHGNQYISLPEDNDLVLKTPLTIQSDMNIFISSIPIEDSTTESPSTSSSEIILSETEIAKKLESKYLIPNKELSSETEIFFSSLSTYKTEEVTNTVRSEDHTKTLNVQEKTSKEQSDDYNDYNDYVDNKTFKDKESVTLKPTVRDQNPRKNKAPILESSRKVDPEDDYDEYPFEDDYEGFDGKKYNRKPTPSLTSSRFKNTRQSKRKSATVGNGDYDDYDDYDYHESESATAQSSSSETASSKETASSSVRIRPFSARGRLTYTTPSRSSTTKASFTIQFRRPSRTRNSRAFGHRSDSENDFDDDLNEDEEEGDIEASEAVVTTATPQVLSFSRRKQFGNSRYQPPGRNSVTTSTSRPVNIGRNRKPFGRVTAGNPSPTPSIKENVPDYDENTTEDDEFDDYDDFSDKKDSKGLRNFRSTRRPPSRVTRFGERRSASNKRGSFRHREEEETENDDLDSTTPNYRNSRNRINQRKPSSRRHNRNNSPQLKTSFNSVTREEDDDSQSLQPLNRVRGNNRNRRPNYNPRTRRPSKTVTETPTIKKPYLTVTSVVTTIKTLPIYHGFRTSYATLTTTALDTSIIHPTQYSEVVNDGITKTLFYSKTGYPDGIENLHTTITEVVVTTTSLASVKLVPIKIGFSTRTDTITDIQVLTTLSTMYSTITPDTPQPTAFPQQFQPNFYPQLGPQNPDFYQPQNADYGLLASANSFVTTQIVTSTTVVPIILRGRTILSTLTTTSLSESTVVQTVRLPQVPSPAPYIPQPYYAFQPLTTLLTLYVTGEHGELKPVVTTVTVPLYQQPVFHTKVARSLQRSAVSEHTLKTADFMDIPLSSSLALDYSRDIDIDTHYDNLLSSGLEEINDLSEKSSSQMQTEPLDSTRISDGPNGITTYDVTTISKGPLTEIYEQKVTVNLNTGDESLKQNEIEHSKDIYGLESRYSFRKLQQFIEEDPTFRPQRDFTRLRRPPAGVILATVANPSILIQPNTQSPPVRVRPRQFPPSRRQPIERETSALSDSDSISNGVRGSTFVRRPLRRPEGNFRPFIERPVEESASVDNENRPPFPSSIVIESSRSNTVSENEFEPARVRNTNGVSRNGFDGSPTEGTIDDGFQPITNIRELRRGPGPLLNELNPSSDVTPRSRRLRITRPISGELTSGVVRRITRVRSSIALTATPSIDESDIASLYDLSTPSLISPTFVPSTLSEPSNDENAVSDDIEEPEKENDHEKDINTSRRTVIRRLRPSFIPGDGSGARRPLVVRRTRVNEKSSVSPEPVVSTSDVLTSSFETNVNPASESFISENLTTDNGDNEEELNGVSKPPVKKIVRLRKPENGDQTPSGPRRRIVVSRRPQDIAISNTVQARGPVTSIELSDKQRNNLLLDTNHDSEDFNKIVAVPNRNVEHLPAYSTKTYPITYYTTLTYYTTFLHGPDINYASRVAVFSNIIDHTLNPSLINAIRFNMEQNRQPSTVSTVHLASRTLGDTTTIVNLASQQSIYNSEINNLLTAESVSPKITSTSSVADITRGVVPDTMNINVVASLPKTFYTLFTYSYTFFDGTNVRESTRAETMTKINSDPSQFLSESIGTYINRDGLLNVGPVTRTLHLGSREVEGTTTEVNLGLKTLIKFDNVKNAVIETTQPFHYITPTRTYGLDTFTTSNEIPKSSQLSTLSPSYLESSYASANDLFGVNRLQDISTETTPLISSELPETASAEDKKPIIKVTSVIHKPTGPLKSGVFNPRPGVRVRVRPVVSRRLVPSELVSSFDISFDVNEIASEYPGEVPLSPQYIPPSVNIGAIPTPVLEEPFLTNVMTSDIVGHDNELASEDDFDENVATTDGAVVPTRKKLKVTVRRPQSESVSRTHTRFVLPSRFEITSKPRFYVVTRTGALGVVSNSQRPFTVRISKKLKPTVTELISPSTTVIYDTYTTLTSVPVIFGLETSFRNVLLTTSSPITVSFVPSPTYDSDSSVIMPSTVVLTYFTTTTFTIPYIVDDQTLFTTLEETNSRVVTSTLDGADSPAFTATGSPPEGVPPLSLYTSVEFGFDGPVIHTLSSPSFATAYEELPLSPITTYYDTVTTYYDTPALYETKTFYTTYTFFTTLFAGTEPVVSSSEQVVTNVVTVPATTQTPQVSSVIPEVIGPVTVFDTSETVITKTNYNTITFYATLFSDTSSFVTPIEEVQTEIMTITDTYTITRTILPTPSASLTSATSTTPSEITSFVPELEPSVVVTQTLYTTYTNFVTLFQGSDTVVTNLEEIVSNVVTMTVPAHAASSFSISSTPTSTESIFEIMTTEVTPVYTTREIVSTQTHYLTLFNKDESLLSSIEEVVTTYVTELVQTSTPSYSSYSPFVPESRFTYSPELTLLSSEILTPSSELYTPFTPTSETSEETTSEISTYHPELVPSIRTIYSTLTFYTTYYSDTSSIVASQEEVLTSFVTLFVPPSLITSSTSTSTEDITPTSTTDPSVFVFTTTDYSTLTLYTTLFSGDEIVVISSEHVVPEVITATITPSSIAPTETESKDESVLTFLTTFTYYTTYFSGTDPVIASSESVVTQFVTIEAPPSISTSSETSIEATPAVETIIGVSTASTANIMSSFDEILSDVQIIGVSSAVATSSAIEPSIETKVQIESKVHTEVGSDTMLSSPVMSTEDVTEKSTFDVGVFVSDITSELPSSILSVDGLFNSSTKDDIMPVTTSSILTEKTEIVGLDGIVTSMVPSDTLVMVTGTDGFVTKLAEIDTVVLSPVYIPPTDKVSASSSSEIKPATVIELSDLLGGNTAFGGDIGLAIKDIVSLITGKKNKTEDNVTTEKLSTDLDSTTEATTESIDSTEEDSSEKDSTSPNEETTTEKDGIEKVILASKDIEYPIFVLPTKENETETVSEILTPVYVPTETRSTSQTEISTKSSVSQDLKKSVSKISKSVSTSVITGARTVFIVPTKATSTTDENRDRYTIEARVPKIDMSKETSLQQPQYTRESSYDTAKKSSTSFIQVSKETSIPKFEISSVSSHDTRAPTKIEIDIETSMSSPSREDVATTTPHLRPSVGTSIVSGIRTVFFEHGTDKTQKSQANSVSSSTKEEVLGRANVESSSSKPFTTITKGGQTVVSRTTSGATTIFFPGQIPKYTMPVISTRYITSVESITRTLALTTTRTYYTRDSTLTVPSVYTTTIPPRTFVSTIIGSRTILGILPEPTETVQIHKTIEPSERTTTVTTTTLIFNSIPSTVIRTLVLPTIPTKTVNSETSSTNTVPDSNVFSAGTEKPARPPEVGDSTAIIREEEEPEVKLGGVRPVQKARDETYLRAANPRIHDSHPDVQLEDIRRPPIVVTEAIRPENDPFLNGRNGVCDPKCQPYKKEVCKEKDGFWSCLCRPGHARRDEHEICKEIQTYTVLLKVVKMGNESIDYNNGLADNGSKEFKDFVKNVKEGIADAYSITNVKDHIWDAEVNEIMPLDGVKSENDVAEATTISGPQPGVIVNFTMQVSKSVSGKLLEQELTRSLQLTHMRVGDSALLAAPLSQNVQDYNECLDPRQNDCALRAECVNLPGSYTCKCTDGFEDMDANLPGRICLARTENCNYCHGRGDCLRADDDKTYCRCQPMFVGRRCEINGLVLAIALPTAVAVVVLLLCAVLCCCRKCKKKSPNNSAGDPGNVFRGIALKGPVGGTLDRKAMIDTSSESSGEHGGRKGPMAFDGYQESGDVTPHKSSKRSDLSLNRSLSTGYTSPPVMIPRAKQPQIPNKPMNYTVYDGQVYVW